MSCKLASPASLVQSEQAVVRLVSAVSLYYLKLKGVLYAGVSKYSKSQWSGSTLRLMYVAQSNMELIEACYSYFHSFTVSKSHALKH